jgi:branched-chain amino acid transport system ATP-binding protein
MAALIEARDVSKSYGSFRALSGVTLAVADDEFVSIVGHNGAGKTTLVNILTGLLRPTSGTVTFKGLDVAGVGPVRLARLGMARAFQLVHIFPGLTVRQTLAVAVVSQGQKTLRRLFATLDRDEEVQARVEAVARLFGFEQLDLEARSLSQGAKKLLDVASAFALRPEVILLDEPTSGVSTADKHQVMRVLVDAARKFGVRAIIQIEHDMDLVSEYSDRVVALHNGQILADRPPKDFFTDPELVATVVGKRRPEK